MLPIELQALRPDVPTLILVQELHFRPKWHIHPFSQFPDRTMRIAVLSSMAVVNI